MVRKLIKHPLYHIVSLSFILLVGIPVIYTFINALFIDGSSHNIIQAINKNTILLLGKSAGIAASIAFFSTLLGTILGFILYKTNVKYRIFFKLSLLIPLFVSPYILAVAWKDFFYLFFGTTSYLSTSIGLIFVLTQIFTPVAMLIIGSALSNINSQLEESGIMVTSAQNVIFKITLPLIKPSLITSFILVFIFSISEFSVPAFLGVNVLITEIFTQFSAFYNHSLAIIQSSILIVISILFLFTERKFLSEAPFLSVGNRGSNSIFYYTPQYGGLLFLSIWFIITVVSPYMILAFQSYKGGIEKITQAFKLLLPTFGDSIGLAFFAATIIIFIGFITANFSVTQNKLKTSFDLALLIIFAIPSTILGISLIKFYNHPSLNFIYSSYAIIIIAYVGKFSYIATKLISNALKQLPNSLDEVAQIAGITLLSRQRKIIIPLISPSLFAAFIISFIFCLGELGTTIMLYPPGTEMLPIKVFTMMANAPQSLISSMTLIVFSVTLLIMTTFYFAMKLLVKNIPSNG